MSAYDISPDQIINVRSAEMEIQPLFRPSVQSSPANVYIQEVKAQTADESRMSWVWRSPSASLICSPLAYVTFQLKITSTTQQLTKADIVGALRGSVDQLERGVACPAATVATSAPFQIADDVYAAGEGCRSGIVFGEGNCCQNALESMQISINGATWTELSTNLYNRSLSRCYEPLAVQQKAYSTCGGSCLAYDDTPLSGHVLGLSNAIISDNQGAVGPTEAAARATCGFKKVEGMTMDSSLAQRQKNLASQIVDRVSDAAFKTITVEVRFPLQGGPFNSLWGSKTARSDPRSRMALGIPNLNQGNITLNFKNLRKEVIRRLGRPRLVAGADAYLSQTANIAADDLTVSFDTTKVPVLELTYIRLPSFRNYPANAVLQIYRNDCRPADLGQGGKYGEQVFPKGLFDGMQLTGLRCNGTAYGGSDYTIRPFTADRSKYEFDAVWTGQQFPQVPDYLFFCFQKSSDVYTHKNPLKDLSHVVKEYTITPDNQAATNVRLDTHGHAALTIAKGGGNNAIQTAVSADAAFDQYLIDRFIAQNQASNAAIMQIKITVQSAVGSWEFRANSEPYLQDRDLLWRRHAQNCNDEYMKAGRAAWQDRGSCALLSSSDFLLGLSTGSGVVFPIILDVRIKFQNRSAVQSGALFSGQVNGACIFEDIIVGTPVMVGLFQKQQLTIAPSSAVLSAQNLSQSTFAAAVSR